MKDQQEKLWDYDAVEPGQKGTETIVPITKEHISRYAQVSQNPDPQFRMSSNSDDLVARPAVAMPTMVLTYAPLLRDDIAANNGFVALEESKTARRQTPFAKCEIRWHQPVRPGDTITGHRSVLEKYERRGSKFVTFRVEAKNQDGLLAVEYDYTCIFEYAQGQRQVPTDRGSAVPPSPDQQARPDEQNSQRLVNYSSMSIGDSLATLAISESQEVINLKNDFRLAGKTSNSNIHTDEEFARQNIFGGTVNSGPATMSYVDQMLGLSFPQQAFYQGGSLLMRAIEPFRIGDTVTFQGEVTGKRQEAGKNIVECRVKGINQRGDLVCLSDAVMVLGE